VGTILWLAVVGFVIYTILKFFSPDTADRVREMVAGRC
jgi:hypothetical protein